MEAIDAIKAWPILTMLADAIRVGGNDMYVRWPFKLRSSEWVIEGHSTCSTRLRDSKYTKFVIGQINDYIVLRPPNNVLEAGHIVDTGQFGDTVRLDVHDPDLLRKLFDALLRNHCISSTQFDAMVRAVERVVGDLW